MASTNLCAATPSPSASKSAPTRCVRRLPQMPSTTTPISPRSRNGSDTRTSPPPASMTGANEARRLTDVQGQLLSDCSARQARTNGVSLYYSGVPALACLGAAEHRILAKAKIDLRKVKKATSKRERQDPARIYRSEGRLTKGEEFCHIHDS